MRVQRRLTRGLMLTLNYTFSKTIEALS